MRAAVEPRGDVFGFLPSGAPIHREATEDARPVQHCKGGVDFEPIKRGVVVVQRRACGDGHVNVASWALSHGMTPVVDAAQEEDQSVEREPGKMTVPRVQEHERGLKARAEDSAGVAWRKDERRHVPCYVLLRDVVLASFVF